ncbi:MAG: radical SAM protein [Terriglobia bacterium]
MDLLLTHGFFLNEDPKELQIMKPYPPLGLLYLSSYLKSKGYDVEVFDSTFRSRSELYDRLQSSPPGLLGIYANLMTRSSVIAILQVARQCGWEIVLGGPEPANYSEEYLASGADVIVVGEGELTLEELLARRRHRPKTSLADVRGVVIRGAERHPHTTQPRDLIPSLDSLPWPDREAIDIDSYLSSWKSFHGKSSVSLITARGCPYHCRWCSHAVYGKTHRRRSPHSVADEIEWIRERYNPDMLWIADDVFTIHPRWIFEFAKEMKDRQLTIPFECITRADRFNEAIADAMVELECRQLWIGSESGSQRILDAMQRDVTVDQIQRAVSLCKERGIHSGLFLMWGYPGEEITDIEATIEHVKRANPDRFLTTVAYPIKGTDYFREISPSLPDLKQWQHSSDRDYAVRGRRSKSYYHYADQWLRDEISLQRLRQQKDVTNLEELARLQEGISEARRGLAETQAEVGT